MKIQPKYSLDELPGTPQTRVFIACSYEWPWIKIIEEMRRVVEKCAYQPIIAHDFDIPRGATRHFCNTLMDLCNTAIFEVTDRSGQYMELENAHHIQNISKTLCVYQENAIISEMVTSSTIFQENNESYSDSRDLNLIIREFLLVKQR